jgi:septal ring factor EnvC (AmiA/AmiB activator)
MRTTREISDSLKEWRGTMRVHPISLTLDAAITELHRLHEAAAQAAELDNHLDDAIKERNELRAEINELKKRMAAMHNEKS